MFPELIRIVIVTVMNVYDTREHFVDQLVKDRIVKLVQCRTNKMVPDNALTKNLPAPTFEQHRATMLGEDEAPFSAMMCRV